MFEEVELIFNRALKLAFSRNKFLFVFPILILCGLLVVLCRTLSVEAHSWIRVSLAFLPSLLCAGILMAAGIPLVRIYGEEIKGNPVRYRDMVQGSWNMMLGSFSFVAPLILAYLLLWLMMGLFYLFKAIPGVGDVLGVLLSFGPFLLILGSLGLSFLGLFLLFFATPALAQRTQVHWDLAGELWSRLRAQVFSHVFYLALGVLPLLCVVGILTISATLTGLAYFAGERTLAIGAQWLLIMIPFAALLSPAVIFFFNFAAESFAYLSKQRWK